MDAYCAAIKKLDDKFYDIECHYAVRANNQAVKELSKIGSTRTKVPARVFVHDLWPLPLSNKNVTEPTNL